MDLVIPVVALTNIVAHLLLLIYLLLKRGQRPGSKAFVFFAVVVSLLTVVPYVMDDAWQIKLPEGLMGFDLLMYIYGLVVIQDIVTTRRALLWHVLGVVCVVGLTMITFGNYDLPVVEIPVISEALAVSGFPGVALFGWLVVGSILLMGVAFYGFYAAPLPEIANRALFWVGNTLFFAFGCLFAITVYPALSLGGLLLVLLAMTGAVYAHVNYRIFDVRGGMINVIRFLAIVALTAGTIYLMIVLAFALEAQENSERMVTMGALVIIGAVIFTLLRRLLRAVWRRLENRASPTRAARLFSQQISKAVTLDQLVEIGTEALNKVMNVRRSGMILVNDTSDDGQVELLVMQVTNYPGLTSDRGYIKKNSPFYQQLTAHQSPIAQFDLEYNRQYLAMEPVERAFFSSLQMSAYAPIIVEDALIGILMTGPKNNDIPFYQRDLDMLATMGDQAGVALRNARLVADLRHLNLTMKTLNEGLEEANEQFEKLDSVKTDFITIASHELRTPLAQIKGYTDILDALNEQGMLDHDQTAGMVANLRKAIERTETLIGDMLDVSQLDVNAMDLRFTQTSPEAVVRMAIEPLTDPIRQRKLTLSARGLRGLPTIQADMQRLVQAFRNIVVNAIKFTPDGGRIEITASLQPASQPEEEMVLVAISDSGVGIDDENLELIFEKFYRAYDPGLHSTGTYKFLGAGPGLGLTIARGVIESHGGKIWAESSGHNMETCPGTTFYVLLPVSPPENAPRVLVGDQSAEPTFASRSAIMGTGR
jgi:signal transduction histidine kinase